MTPPTPALLHPRLALFRLAETEPRAAVPLSPLSAESLAAIHRPAERVEWMLYGALMLTYVYAVVACFGS